MYPPPALCELPVVVSLRTLRAGTPDGSRLRGKSATAAGESGWTSAQGNAWAGGDGSGGCKSFTGRSGRGGGAARVSSAASDTRGSWHGSTEADPLVEVNIMVLLRVFVIWHTCWPAGAEAMVRAKCGLALSKQSAETKWAAASEQQTAASWMLCARRRAGDRPGHVLVCRGLAGLW